VSRQVIPINTPRCAIYARVSLDRQSESVEHQVSLLKEFATSKQIGIVPNEFIYEDSGVSATKYSIWTRPAMKRLLADAEQGKFQIVMFKGISRFARSTQEALDVLDRLKAKGLRVISLEENYDSGKENSNLIFTIHSAVAEYEAEKIAVRVRLGRKEAAKEGKWTAKPPYGYKLDENFRLTPNEEEAEVVRKIFELYTKKELGSVKIAQYLNEHGIPRPSGSLWNRKMINDIIKNEVYIGNIVFNKTRVQRIRDYESEEQGKKKVQRIDNSPDEWVVAENTHPPLVDKETFREAQKIRGGRKIKTKAPREYHPLSGILYCAKCGRNMFCQKRKYYNQHGKTRYEYRYYICKTYHKYGRSYCDQKNIKADKLEEFVIERLEERMKQVYNEMEVPKERDTTDTTKLEKELINIERKMDKIKKDTADLYFEREKMAEETYEYIAERLKNEMTRLVDRRNEIEREIERAQQEEETNEQLKKYMEEFFDLDKSDTARLRVLFHRLIERIDIEDEHLDIKYRFAF
jgi:site-specific DNA recombinase